MPNTIYLVTDLQHFPKQFMEAVSPSDQAFLFIEYILLFVFGVFSYLFTMYPFGKIFPRIKRKTNPYLIPVVLIVNAAISFGVALGKIERTHSWYVFTDPQRVIKDIIHLLTNPEAVLVIVVFALLCNTINFSFHTVSAKLLK